MSIAIKHEWIAERYQIEWPFFKADARPLYPIDQCASDILAVTRGGSWVTQGSLLSPLVRSGFPSTTHSPLIGFRIAK